MHQQQMISRPFHSCFQRVPCFVYFLPSLGRWNDFGDRFIRGISRNTYHNRCRLYRSDFSFSLSRFFVLFDPFFFLLTDQDPEAGFFA
jgi:hypothetical protein